MGIAEAIPFYRQFGFNLVPLGGDKRPVVVKRDGHKEFRFHWQEWSEKPQTESYWQAVQLFDWWKDVQGLAAICGPVSGGLVCLDFDGLDNAEHVADVAEGLGFGRAYAWQVRSPGGGFHLWFRADGLTLDKGKIKLPGITCKAVELRYTGHYVALPPSIHPSGGVYRWLHGEPKAGSI